MLVYGIKHVNWFNWNHQMEWIQIFFFFFFFVSIVSQPQRLYTDWHTSWEAIEQLLTTKCPGTKLKLNMKKPLFKEILEPKLHWIYNYYQTCNFIVLFDQLWKIYTFYFPEKFVIYCEKREIFFYFFPEKFKGI